MNVGYRVELSQSERDELRALASGGKLPVWRPSIKPSQRPEAPRILRRLEFHYTPRHPSWLNMVEMVEIEIGVIRRQCLDRRIASRDLLETEIRAWERRRAKSGAKSPLDVLHRSKPGPEWPNPIPSPHSTSHNRCDAT